MSDVQPYTSPGNPEALDLSQDSTPPLFTGLGIHRRKTVQTLEKLRNLEKENLYKSYKDRSAKNIFGDIIMNDFEDSISTTIITSDQFALKSLEYSNDVSDGSDVSESSNSSMGVIPNIVNAKRLQNVLKMTLAHRWLVCEFLYSFIDVPIFDSWNNYNEIILERYPLVSKENLTKRERRIAHRFLGSPGRMSQAFFNKEREELERKRNMLRFLQQHKSECLKNIEYFYNMPNEVPLILPNSTKVITKLRKPYGLVPGVIVGHDAKNCTYQVKMDTPDMGKLHVPDVNVFQPSHTKSFSLNNLAYGKNSCTNDLVDGFSIIDLSNVADNVENRHPIELLLALIRLEHLTNIKCAKVQTICEMNDAFERQLSKDLKMPKLKEREQFQKRYVTLMVTLHRLNADILEPLKVMHDYYNEHHDEPGDDMQVARQDIIKKCRETADFAYKHELGHERVKSAKSEQLIKDLHTILTMASLLDHENTINIEIALDYFIVEVSNELPDSAKNIFDTAMLTLFQPLREHIRNMNERIQNMYHLRQFAAMTGNITTEEINENIK